MKIAGHLSPARALTQARLPHDLRNRFEARVAFEPSCGCWLWLGERDRNNYGIMDLRFNNLRRLFAHRVSWVLYRGDLPALECICHRCDTPACVSPDHLFVGSKAVNTADMMRKGRNSYVTHHGERHGNAKFTDEDVRFIRSRIMKGTEYAKMYGTSKSYIYYIQSGKSWTHLQ